VKDKEGSLNPKPEDIKDISPNQDLF